MAQTTHEREGALSNTTFPSLLYTILRRGETGVLGLRDGPIEKSLYVGDGKPLFATSSDPEDRLGTLYLKAGRITIANLLKALDTATATKKRLGTVLVEMGAIKAQDLVEGVLSQVKSTILSLFQWRHGRYRYAPGPLPTDEVITLRLNADRLVLDGVRGIDRWERVWEAVGHLDASYQATKDGEDRVRALKLSPDDAAVLSRCDHPAPLQELCAQSKLSNFDVCRLVWALKTLGLVKRV
jgi:uncharacterized protein DUF4388